MARLQRIATSLWIAEGPTVSFLGFPYPTRAALVQLPQGLWVWSPIALDDELVSEVRALGTVQWIVEPSKLHHLYLRPWLDEFAEAQAYAPPGLRAKRKSIVFAGELGDEPEPAWAGDIDQVVVRGSPAMEELLFFHRPSSTCLVGDLIQRHHPAAFPGWQRLIMRADGMVGERGSTPREWRATFVRRRRAREALSTALSWKPERLVIAHGECALSDGEQALADGLAWVRKPWPL